eukprot:scaffold659_cov192-Ochromonas_danica.AAC.16
MSNVLKGRILSIEADGSITSIGVLKDVSMNWNFHNATTTVYPYFGRNAGKKFAANGGGHAGNGLIGYGNTLSTTTTTTTNTTSTTTTNSNGQSRGDWFYPLGPGGAGGADIGKQVTGGGGGGGLYLDYSEHISINGIIDVSGESAIMGSAAGGGAAYALGYYGGSGGEVPVQGNGQGGGQVGFVGGDGGGHGGIGAPSIDRLHREMNQDQYLGLSNEQVFLDDYNLTMLMTRNSSSYGSYYAPIDMGSGGGGTVSSSSFGSNGGRGGGSIIIYTSNDIVIDTTSSITAAGESVFNGGGGGAGGSIWIRHTTGSTVQAASISIYYNGRVVGDGLISAAGGSTCSSSLTCAQSIDSPGGAGAGGRIRIEKRLESFTGQVNVMSVYNHTEEGEEALDIIFTKTPIYMDIGQ